MEEEPSLRALSWAVYWTLRTNDVYGQVDRIQNDLEQFINPERRGRVEVMDFDKCDIRFLRIFDEKRQKSFVKYRLILTDITHSKKNPNSNYNIDHEHVIVSKDIAIGYSRKLY